MKEATVVAHKPSRESARDVIAALVCRMRAEGMTLDGVRAQLADRAWEEAPEAWSALTCTHGRHAREKPFGRSKIAGLERHGMALRAAQVTDPTHLRDSINARLDALYAALVDKANRDGVDHRVVDTLRKIEADRARLFGLHAREEGGALASAIAELVRVSADRAEQGEEVQQGLGGVEGGDPKTA